MEILMDKREERVFEATVTQDETDYRFELWVDRELGRNGYHNELVIEYQESQIPSGFDVKEPRDEVWAELLASDEMSEIIRQYNVVAVERKNQELVVT